MFNRFPRPQQNSFIDIDHNSGEIDIDVMQAQNTNTIMSGGSCGMNAMAAPMPMQAGMSMASAPIVEVPRERVLHKQIYHEVPHVCPVVTKVVNHHIYRHTYQPRYSCCEENVCEQVQCGSCCNY